jgi:CHAD domain-containing protein
MAWRFDPGEELCDAFRRVAGEEIAKVRAGLADDSRDRAKAIHDARQGFKRLRALLRLAQPSLGPAFDGENRLWRDAGRQLAGSRDQTVLLESFDKIVAACGAGLPPADVKRLRSHLAGDGGDPGRSDVEASVCGVLIMLEEAEGRIAALEWPADVKALAKGLKRSQARLRTSWKAARKTEEARAFHDWRKRVKDQSAQLRLLRRIVPPTFRSRHGDEKKTAELLGEEHDYWMLAERLSKEGFPAQALTTRDVLLRAVGERREALRAAALKLGKAFSSQQAKTFARELTAAWQKAGARRHRKSAEKRAISQAS